MAKAACSTLVPLPREDGAFYFLSSRISLCQEKKHYHPESIKQINNVSLYTWLISWDYFISSVIAALRTREVTLSLCFFLLPQCSLSQIFVFPFPHPAVFDNSAFPKRILAFVVKVEMKKLYANICRLDLDYF